MNLLFLCSRNRRRSPTAEAVFAGRSDVECDSAGLADDADHVLSADQLEWADIIFVMEKRHLQKLKRRYGRSLTGQKLICLDIPDRYEANDPDLMGLITQRVTPHLC